MSDVLETPRLWLRELEPTDLPDLLEILGDADAMRYYPAAVDRERVSDWIAWARRSYGDNGFGLRRMCLCWTDRAHGAG